MVFSWSRICRVSFESPSHVLFLNYLTFFRTSERKRGWNPLIRTIEGDRAWWLQSCRPCKKEGHRHALWNENPAEKSGWPKTTACTVRARYHDHTWVGAYRQAPLVILNIARAFFRYGTMHFRRVILPSPKAQVVQRDRCKVLPGASGLRHLVPPREGCDI